MSRFEMHMTTTVEGDSGGVISNDDLVMCFVEDELDRQEVEDTAKAVMASHCEFIAEFFEIIACAATIYVREKPELYLKLVRKDVEDNVVYLHPDRGEMN